MAKAMDIPQPAVARSELSLRDKVTRFDTRVSPYVYIAPFFILFAVFGAFPLV